MRKIHHSYTNRHGTYYLRLQIPSQLRQYTAQRELRVSLKTKQPSQAMLRSAAGLNHAQTVFEWIKRKMTEIEHQGNTDKISLDAAETIKSEDDQIWKKLLEKNDGDHFEAQRELINTGIQWLKQFVPTQINNIHNDYDNDYLEAVGFTAIRARNKTKVTLDEVENSIIAARQISTSHITQPFPLPGSVIISSSKTCSEVVNDYIRSNKVEWGIKAEEKASRFRVIRELMEHVAKGKQISSLDSEDWSTIFSRVKYLPLGSTTENLHRHLDEIDEAFNSAIPPIEGTHIIRETRKSMEQRLKRICAHASDKEWIRRDFLANTSTVVISKKEKRENKYKDFELIDIKKLLQGHLYQDLLPSDCKGKKYREWLFWMLPIALYSGMRQSEIAQLHLEDIVTQDKTGITYFRIHDEGKRTVKNEASIRNVPLHDKLIQAGFLSFVQKHAGQTYLFPELWVNKDGVELAKVNSNKVNKFFNGEDGKNPKKGYFEAYEITDPKKVFHSTRHTVVGNLRSKQVGIEYISQIVGHDKELLGTTAHYGDPVSLEIISEKLNQLDYGIHGSLDHISFKVYEKRKPKPKRTVKRAKPRVRRGYRA